MSGRKGNVPQLVVAIAEGRSIASAAASAGMSLSTAQRRMREPEVLDAIQEARVDLTRQALGRVRGLRDVALDRLVELLSGDLDPALTLRAVGLVLRHATAADTAGLHERVLQLERLLSAELTTVLELGDEDE